MAHNRKKKYSLGLFLRHGPHTLNVNRASAFSSYSMAFIWNQEEIVSCRMDDPRRKADLEEPELNIY